MLERSFRFRSARGGLRIKTPAFDGMLYRGSENANAGA
jgi:hypothetical protein